MGGGGGTIIIITPAFIGFSVAFREFGVRFRLESYLLIVNAKNEGEVFLYLVYMGLKI